MNKRDFYPTIEDLKKMNLTEYQISQLIKWENSKHSFRNQYQRLIDFSKPNSIFFLDIKGTLYHSGGHNNNGVLGRSQDSLPIHIIDILSLGRLLYNTTGQALNMNYSLDENENATIEYNFPKSIEKAKYKFDIPTEKYCFGGLGLSYDYIDNGPFKIVFISNDSVETQKNIVLFLLTINMMWNIKVDSQVVLELEQIFEQSNCDLDIFISKVPQKYRYSFDEGTRKNIKNIMSRITFLSTKDLSDSKESLMKKFLEEYNIKNGLTYSDYNIFACGDSYEDDGAMINQAFLLGGYGCLNCNSFWYENYEELLRKELYEKYRKDKF